MARLEVRRLVGKRGMESAIKGGPFHPLVAIVVRDNPVGFCDGLLLGNLWANWRKSQASSFIFPSPKLSAKFGRKEITCIDYSAVRMPSRASVRRSAMMTIW